MSSEFISRLIGMIVFGVGGFYLGAGWARLANADNAETARFVVVFALIGVLFGLILTPWLTVRPIRAARRLLGQLSSRTLLSGLFGLIVSLIISGLLALPLSLLPRPFSQILPLAAAIVLAYLGVVIFIARQNDILSIFSFLPSRGGDSRSRTAENGRTILLDTSVIIDGRIVDIVRTGFLSGSLLIPRFVLAELQHIADSGDKLRRQRGRRQVRGQARLRGSLA